MAASVYLIFGEDEYLVSTKAKEIVDRLVPPADRALGLEVIEGRIDTVSAAVEALSRCKEALQTMGFFGNQKVVWFRDVSFLTDNAVGMSETVKQRVNELTTMLKSGLPASQILMVTSARVDKRYAFYRTCKEVGEVHEFAVPDKGYLAQRQALGRLRETLSQTGLNMQQDLLNVFLEKTGTDTRQIVSEINKLAVFMGERREVGLDDIEAVTSSSGDALAWDLADAFGRRELGRALEVLRQLIFQKESPIGLIIAIENRIRDLIVYREALDKGWLQAKSADSRGSALAWRNLPAETDAVFSEEFSKDPRGTHPYRTGLLAKQAKLFSPRQLRECHEAVMEAHMKLVSSSIPQSLTLEYMLIRMLS